MDDDEALYDFRPSGVVHVTFGGQQRTLRAPLLADLRAIRTAQHEADQSIQAAGQELRAELLDVQDRLLDHQARLMEPTAREQRIHVLTAMTDRDPRRDAELKRLKAAKKTGDPAEYRGLLARASEITSELDDAALDAWGSWAAATFTALGAECTPDVLPLPFCTAEFSAVLLAHWRAVPPPPGR